MAEVSGKQKQVVFLAPASQTGHQKKIQKIQRVFTVYIYIVFFVQFALHPIFSLGKGMKGLQACIFYNPQQHLSIYLYSIHIYIYIQYIYVYTVYIWLYHDCCGEIFLNSLAKEAPSYPDEICSWELDTGTIGNHQRSSQGASPLINWAIRPMPWLGHQQWLRLKCEMSSNVRGGSFGRQLR